MTGLKSNTSGRMGAPRTWFGERKDLCCHDMVYCGLRECCKLPLSSTNFSLKLIFYPLCVWIGKLGWCQTSLGRRYSMDQNPRCTTLEVCCWMLWNWRNKEVIGNEECAAESSFCTSLMAKVKEIIFGHKQQVQLLQRV